MLMNSVNDSFFDTPSAFQTAFKELNPSINELLKCLNPDQQQHFWSSAQQVPLNEWKRLINTLSETAEELDGTHWVEPTSLHPDTLAAQGYNPQSTLQAGIDCFSKGSVAFLTVAGGLGSRLGFNGPKGLVPVTPLQHKPLYQVFAEKLKALQRRYQRPFHWFIMTSEETDTATQIAFAKQAWYDPHYIHFFKQGSIPAFLNDGQCALKADGNICFLPNGHGGLFKALEHTGYIELFKSLGITSIYYFQVDNPLIHLDDPLFLGTHCLSQSSFSTKVVVKTDPQERVGLLVQDAGQLRLIEYNQFPEALSQEVTATGALRYRFGNTGIHLITTEFIQKCAQLTLPYHVCRKKIPIWDPQSQTTYTTEGYKLEQFIFDVLPVATRPLLWEVDRKDEFSPVKNAVGKDTLETCQRDQINRWHRWLQAVGESLEFSASESESSTNLPTPLMEIGPLFADNQVDFIQAWKQLDPKPKTLQGLYLHDES